MRDRWLIDGHWLGDRCAAWLTVHDPATGAEIARVPSAGETEARQCVDAAAAAGRGWAAQPAEVRADLLDRAAETLDRRLADLARGITLECGKPLRESEGEVRYSSDYLRSAAREIRTLHEEPFETGRAGTRGVAVHEPIGVCAAVTPWNFPLAMLARKVAPAVAAGCTVVAKPAEETPLSALAFAEALQASGLPPGVLNVIVGEPAPIVDTWLADPRVRKLTFTGSTETGRLLLRGAAEQVIRCSMELGGHAAFIVLAGADVDQAVAGAMAAKFRNAGQTCICPNRFLVHRSIATAFTARLALAAAELVPGRGVDPASTLGPLINDAGVGKVRRHVADAVMRGARLVSGGQTEPLPGCLDRFFLPTVLADCGPDMLCFREETFGPVAPVMPVSDAEEAVRVANASPWGLAGYVFGPRPEAEAVARRLACGVVGVNEAAPSNARAPFGGVKWSGFGREGGPWGLMEYLTVKYLAIGQEG
ncbi:MAG: NAD-dependent succinate-semialdehyde dehydrogenase [Planctomycetes bacterium]|nr:NAD-dependent succinate-semialdehyde dehydrogenase [Planctomycetota bacterium]